MSSPKAIITIFCLGFANSIYADEGLHVSQNQLTDLIQQNKMDEAFIKAFADAGLDETGTIHFDLAKDMPDNVMHMNDGTKVHLGNFLTDLDGRAVVELFSDLRRHRMGDELAESIDAAGTGADTFITKELWGVGSTAPYLHDGRATTLLEAIGFHGGEAKHSRALFKALSNEDQETVIAFMNNLILFKDE